MLERFAAVGQGEHVCEPSPSLLPGGRWAEGPVVVVIEKAGSEKLKVALGASLCKVALRGSQGRWQRRVGRRWCRLGDDQLLAILLAGSARGSRRCFHGRLAASVSGGRQQGPRLSAAAEAHPGLSGRSCVAQPQQPRSARGGSAGCPSRRCGLSRHRRRGGYAAQPREA